MSKLYLLRNYNNYFNQKKYKPLELSEYLEYEHITLTATNFRMNDGVNTEHVINTNVTYDPDYLIVCDDSDTIKSRWFVIESTKTTGAQSLLKLKRDVICDSYDIVKSAPCYIQKATLEANNKLIFNSEGCDFNQIKTQELLVGNDCGWIVGYLAKNAGQIEWNVAPEGTYIDIGTTLENWQYYINPQESRNSQVKTANYLWTYGVYNYVDRTTLTCDMNENITRGTTVGGEVMMAYYRDTAYTKLKEKVLEYGAGGLTSLLNAQIQARGDIEAMLWYNDKTIKTSDNKLYKVKYVSAQAQMQGQAGGELLNAMMDIAEAANIFTNTDRYESYKCYATFDAYTGSYEELPTDGYSGTTSTTRWKCADSPLYDMFAIPYNNVFCASKGTTSKDVSIAVATSLAQKASSNCYDLQILPYCPMMEYKLGWDSSVIALAADDEGYGWQEVKVNDVFKTVILYPTKANQSFTITSGIFSEATTAEDIKVANECDMYRLVSPNGCGSFEFSAVKNGGVDYFDADITYKPYSPYIHIAPHFAGLYGQDFNDFRGLTCQGDFSFGTLADKWADYELNNKNYANIFNREVESMDKLHKYEMGSQIAGAVAGAAGAGFMGSRLNPAMGIGLGAVSLAAGAVDTAMMQGSYKEQKSLKTDLYNYQLGNIKALPYSIAKTSALTANNKILPYVEYYTCTDEEKDMFRYKLQYNGMTVNAIGKIEDYQQDDLTFIQGQIIRLDNLDEDSHYADEIYNEIAKGVYI